MIKIQTIEYPGKQEIFNNFDKYKKIFLEDGVIPFRNAFCDREDQEEIIKFFGDQLGWWPNSTLSINSNYEETHERHMHEKNIGEKDSLMLDWHLEHVHLKEDIYVGASWCMNLFKCAPDAGKTYFFNMLKFYRSLPKEDKDFLKKSEAKIANYWSRVAQSGSQPEEETYALVQKHWLHNEDTLRLFVGSLNDTKLYKFNGNMPTKEQEEKFIKILTDIIDFIKHGDEFKMVHFWEEGDMLVSDMFVMAHAVSGGFSQGQRRLDGIFAKLRIS
jgi:alpha-ketoglutarate-dependent taurine dioxygenase